MPTLRRTKKAYARKRRKYAKKKTFMPRSLAVKRKQQISTKVFYFKSNGWIGTVGSNTNINKAWVTMRAILPPPPPPPLDPYPIFYVPNIGADYDRVSRVYQEYKILAMVVKLFPANVGTESDAPGITANPFNRGNSVTYVDNSIDPGTVSYNAIDQVMNLGSAKMLMSRHRHTRTIYRPSGNNVWGSCDPNAPVRTRVSDPWRGGIYLVANDVTPGMPRVWFYTVTFKVIFRSRNFISAGTTPFELEDNIV